VEVLATVAFALSGLLAAARKRLDAVGVCVVAGLAAFGGGTLRDVLLDRRPFFWVQHAHWLWVLLALCIVALLAGAATATLLRGAALLSGWTLPAWRAGDEGPPPGR